MEAIPLPRRWEDFGEFRYIFKALRSAQSEHMILDENFFIEAIATTSTGNNGGEECSNTFQSE
jgi:haloalkane dehalogenase